MVEPDRRRREHDLDALLAEFNLERKRTTPSIALSGGGRRGLPPIHDQSTIPPPLHGAGDSCYVRASLRRDGRFLLCPRLLEAGRQCPRPVRPGGGARNPAFPKKTGVFHECFVADRR